MVTKGHISITHIYYLHFQFLAAEFNFVHSQNIIADPLLLVAQQAEGVRVSCDCYVKRTVRQQRLRLREDAAANRDDVFQDVGLLDFRRLLLECGRVPRVQVPPVRLPLSHVALHAQRLFFSLFIERETVGNESLVHVAGAAVVYLSSVQGGGDLLDKCLSDIVNDGHFPVIGGPGWRPPI